MSMADDEYLDEICKDPHFGEKPGDDWGFVPNKRYKRETEIVLNERYAKPKNTSIVELFRRKLDGSDYGLGSLEATAATAENNSEAIGNLVDALIRRGVLKLNDIQHILGLFETHLEYPKGEEK